MENLQIWCGDSSHLPLEDDAADLVFFSPPYEDARMYGTLGFKLRGVAWVQWMMDRVLEAGRISRGIVACVVNGRTKDFCWSGTPFMLWLAMHEAGLFMRKPLIFRRDGIPGSGGPDWFKDNYEFVICGSRRYGRLDTIDNKAMGKPPKFKPGGGPSYRRPDGSRAADAYVPPEIANPGNIINCIVGGGHMGHKLSHENEAPFPEYLAEWVVRSLSRPGSLVVDIMAGSGTTLAVAAKCGRRAIGVDIRIDQCELMQRRLEDEVKIRPAVHVVQDGRLVAPVPATDTAQPAPSNVSAEVADLDATLEGEAA